MANKAIDITKKNMLDLMHENFPDWSVKIDIHNNNMYVHLNQVFITKKNDKERYMYIAYVISRSLRDNSWKYMDVVDEFRYLLEGSN